MDQCSIKHQFKGRQMSRIGDQVSVYAYAPFHDTNNVYKWSGF